MTHVGRAVMTVMVVAGSGIVGCITPERAPSREETAVGVGPAVPAPQPRDSGSDKRVATAAVRRRIVISGVDLTRVGYDRGRADAPIVVVNFSDFGCPFCGQFERETLPALHREFVETRKVCFKDIPFVMGMFPNGNEAALAAECAADAAERLGVRVTPSFLVNGRPIEGALPLAEFRRLLNELLQ